MRYILQNAIIHTITDGIIPNGTVVIQENKIKHIGEYIPHEQDTIIDCKGKSLFPGFIDVHTHLGLYDEGTGWAGNDANETIDVLTPHIRSLDGIHALDIGFKEAIAHGITTVHVMPGSGNVIGGTTCTLKTFGTNVEKMIIDEPAGLKIALGENPERIHSHGNSESITRMGIMGMLRSTFSEAMENEHFFRSQSIIKALRREIPVRIHAHRADDILSAIRFAEEFNLDLRIEHCTEGHFIVEELASRDIQVCIGPTLTRRSKIELKNRTWDTYKILAENGVPISITTDHPYTPIQYLNICAGIAVREGLPEKTAFEAITINAAKNLRLSHRIGSISIGEDADLVLWSHHPFHYEAKPIFTMIDGKIVYTNSQYTT